MKRFKKQVTLITLIAALSVGFTACGSSSDSSKDTAKVSATASATESTTTEQATATKSTGSVRKITIGYITNGYPIAYQDDKGNVTGCDIEGMKLVDELLPDYEFEYVGMDQNAVYAGLQSGKFQVALTNSFWTPEREEKYLFPKENLGASVVGLFTRKDDADVKNFEDAFKKELKLTPILAGDGLYYVVQKYNEANPNTQIKLTATDDVNSFTSAFKWVVEGRYDFGLCPKYYYDVLVEAEDGSLHQYKDKLNYTTFTAVKTWSILAKGEDEFADALDGALKQIKSEGKLVELAKKFHGYNTFEYLAADAK